MKKIFFLLIPVICFSCNHTDSVNKADIDLLADKMCRAITYRKQRFSCADQIRSIQDTLSHTNNRTESSHLQTRLNILLKEKASLVKESVALADTIRLSLDRIMPFGDKKLQEQFTEELNTVLSEKGCKN
jgi:hypothetical protein